LPQTATIIDPNDVGCRAQLNGNYHLQVGDTVLLTSRGEVWPVKSINGKLIQTLKVSGQQYEIPLVKARPVCRNPISRRPNTAMNATRFNASGWRCNLELVCNDRF
jgi:NAD-dependent DNA ligase